MVGEGGPGPPGRGRRRCHPARPRLTQEALDELIGNAVNQTPREGLSRSPARRENGCEVIGVADRGPGIRRTTRSRSSSGSRAPMATASAGHDSASPSCRRSRRRTAGRWGARPARRRAVVELRLPRQNAGHVPAVPEMAPASAALRSARPEPRREPSWPTYAGVASATVPRRAAHPASQASPAAATHPP
mgnify:CR=1 FL=1